MGTPITTDSPQERSQVQPGNDAALALSQEANDPSEAIKDANAASQDNSKGSSSPAEIAFRRLVDVHLRQGLIEECQNELTKKLGHAPTEQELREVVDTRFKEKNTEEYREKCRHATYLAVVKNEFILPKLSEEDKKNETRINILAGEKLQELESNPESKKDLENRFMRRVIDTLLTNSVKTADQGTQGKEPIPPLALQRMKELAEKVAQNNDDKEAKAQLEAIAGIYYAQATTRLCAGRWLMSAHNGDQEKRAEAHKYAEEAQKHFAELDKAVESDPQLRDALKPIHDKWKESTDKLMTDSRELAWYERAGKYIVEELPCDIPAMIVGGATFAFTAPSVTVLAAETGPAAPVIGIGAGTAAAMTTSSATYNFMKWALYGETPTLESAFWGALDGLPLPGAGWGAKMGTKALLEVGGKAGCEVAGKVIIKEFATEGAKVLTRESLGLADKSLVAATREGLVSTTDALKLARAEAKAAKEGVSLAKRTLSHVPFIPGGNQAYRTAIGEVRSLAAQRAALHYIPNLTAGVGAALPYELSYAGRQYSDGVLGPDGQPKYPHLYNAIADAGYNTVGDGFRFASVGAYGSGALPGFVTSFATNGIRNARYNNAPVDLPSSINWAGSTLLGTVTDAGAAVIPSVFVKIAPSNGYDYGTKFLASGLPLAARVPSDQLSWLVAPEYIWDPYTQSYTTAAEMGSNFVQRSRDGKAGYSAEYLQFLMEAGLAPE